MALADHLDVHGSVCKLALCIVCNARVTATSNFHASVLESEEGMKQCLLLATWNGEGCKAKHANSQNEDVRCISSLDLVAFLWKL